MSYRILRLMPFLAAIVLLCVATPVRAGLIITVNDLTLPEGDTGFVDVNIRSEPGDDILLDFFVIDLEISAGLAGRQLEYVGPSDTHLADPDYLFAGNSTGDSSNLLFNNTYFSGGDGRADIDIDVPVPTTDTLLVRLEVTAATSSPPLGGDVFTISVAFAEFVTPTFDTIPEDMITYHPGTVRITSASNVVPEPASFAVWSCLVLVGTAGMRRRRRAIRQPA